jgi:hypothetical protein
MKRDPEGKVKEYVFFRRTVEIAVAFLHFDKSVWTASKSFTLVKTFQLYTAHMIAAVNQNVRISLIA